MSSLGGQNAAVGSEGGTVHTQHAPTRFGWCRGLVVGGGIAATVALQDREIKKLKLALQELKEKAAHDSSNTMDNLVAVRNERQEDDQMRTEEMEAMEGRLNDLEKELYSKLCEVTHHIIVSLFSLLSEAPEVHRVEGSMHTQRRPTCFGGEGGDLPKVKTQTQQDRQV